MLHCSKRVPAPKSDLLRPADHRGPELEATDGRHRSPLQESARGCKGQTLQPSLRAKPGSSTQRKKYLWFDRCGHAILGDTALEGHYLWPTRRGPQVAAPR